MTSRYISPFRAGILIDESILDLKSSDDAWEGCPFPPDSPCCRLTHQYSRSVQKCGSKSYSHVLPLVGLLVVHNNTEAFMSTGMSISTRPFR